MARAVFRTELEAHHGRVVDMAGDSVLALFETAAGAVNAALAIQASIDAQTNAVPAERRLRFRIGVHLGVVIGKADGTVYGDGVNIAARLQALAEPGGITVSESIRSAVKGKVKAIFTDLGEQSVKNIADSVRAHAAVSTEATLVAATGVDISAPVAGFGGRPAIAVLPFANLSGDAEQEYFADGLAEDILTRLATVALAAGDRAQFELQLQGTCGRREGGGPRARCALRARRQRAQVRQPCARDWSADRRRNRTPPVG